MERSLPIQIAACTCAVLLALTIPVAPSLAQDAELPAWLTPNASYAGVWKTLGANPAPDLESQITFGHDAPDGSTILIHDDGRLALRYGINPVGAPNHTVSRVLATRTADGFRWGQFDPSRNSAEFTFTVSDDGAILKGARHAMFNGREYFNVIEMTRVDSSMPGAASAQPAAFTPPGGERCLLQERFPPVSQNGQPFKEQFRVPGDRVAPEHAGFVGAWSGRSADSSEKFRLVVFRVGAPDTRLAFVGASFQSQGFWTPELIEGGVLQFESSFGNGNTFRMLEDGATVELTRGVPGRAAVSATLVRCSLD